MRRVLVIKLGALGDFVQATGAFASIRQHEQHAHITLLTTKAMLPLAEKLPWFDHVQTDSRQPFYRLGYLCRLRRFLKQFDMVYDLQTNSRTGYYYLLAGRPQWNGIAKGCSFRHTNPNRNHMHTLNRLEDQLKAAGVVSSFMPNLSLAGVNSQPLIDVYQLNNFVVLVPGGSAHRPEKRWPHFAELAEKLRVRGYQTVLVGGNDEAALLQSLAQQTGAVNLCGKTSLNELITLFPQAKWVVGNDTGPMHIAAASDARCVVLFGHASKPELCAPRSPHTHVLQQENIEAISPQQILHLMGFSVENGAQTNEKKAE